MSKAQELKRLRNDSPLTERNTDYSENAETLEHYFARIQETPDDDAAIKEYEARINAVREDFLEKTRIQREDWAFLFFATMLQCARIYVMNQAFKLERANVKGGREDALHDVQDKILKPFGEGNGAQLQELYAPLSEIISIRGVPYDATTLSNKALKNLHLFKGGNHRFSTLGHDPVLGLVIGTANILTNTITTNRKVSEYPSINQALDKLNLNIISTSKLPATFHVIYDSNLKNPMIGKPVSTIEMLKAAGNRLEDDKKSVAAAMIKQLIHIATDLYTPCGIQLPGANLVLSTKNVELLTKYISTGDVIKAGVSASIAVFFNLIISAIHGCCFMESNDTSEYAMELFQARTKKILMYSNMIASTSSIVYATVSKDVKSVDIGGLLVTIYRIFNDSKFIAQLEYEFINSGVSEIYDEQYNEVEKYFSD